MVTIRFLDLGSWTAHLIAHRDHRAEPWVHLDQYAVSFDEGDWWRLIVRGTANVGVSTWTAWESMGESMHHEKELWSGMKERASTLIREITERLEAHGVIVLPGVLEERRLEHA